MKCRDLLFLDVGEEFLANLGVEGSLKQVGQHLAQISWKIGSMRTIQVFENLCLRVLLLSLYPNPFHDCSKPRVGLF